MKFELLSRALISAAQKLCLTQAFQNIALSYFSLAAIVNVRLIHLSHLHEFTFLKFIASKWMLLPN